MKAIFTWTDRKGQIRDLPDVEVRLSRDAKGYEIVDGRFQQFYYPREETSFYGRTLVIHADRQPPQLKPPTLNTTSGTNRFNTQNAAAPRTFYNQVPNNMQRNPRANAALTPTAQNPARPARMPQSPAPIITRYDGDVTTHQAAKPTANSRAQRLQNSQSPSGRLDGSLLRRPLRKAEPAVPSQPATRVLRRRRVAPNTLNNASKTFVPPAPDKYIPKKPQVTQPSYNVTTSPADAELDRAIFAAAKIDQFSEQQSTSQRNEQLPKQLAEFQDHDSEDAVYQFHKGVVLEYADTRGGVSLDPDSDSDYEGDDFQSERGSQGNASYQTADKMLSSSPTSSPNIVNPDSRRPSTFALYQDQSSRSSQRNSVRISREDSESDAGSVASSRSSRPTIPWNPPSSYSQPDFGMDSESDYGSDDDRPVPSSPRPGR